MKPIIDVKHSKCKKCRVQTKEKAWASFDSNLHVTSRKSSHLKLIENAPCVVNEMKSITHP